MVVGERVQISPRKALRQAITTGRETIVRTEALGGCEATTTFAEKVCGRTATRQLEASKRRDPGAQFPFREWQDEVNSAHMGVHNFSVTQQSPPQQPQDANAEKQRERERGRRSSKPSSLPQPEPLRDAPNTGDEFTNHDKNRIKHDLMLFRFVTLLNSNASITRGTVKQGRARTQVPHTGQKLKETVEGDPSSAQRLPIKQAHRLGLPCPRNAAQVGSSFSRVPVPCRNSANEW
eukprot:CAMPEP_0198127916 /NCGR_PEP_ID=MMETSP1442-20131203/48240_1 /TAXON_ID= /ORGANISM="Craspedostauros australis, Strain CCMP3328" /LENGTH=234 /DNA_ID=CAMNT_0043787989 /DNA_START=1065 /DNA_END=1767 /DNA_ORIENTATION=+